MKSTLLSSLYQRVEQEQQVGGQALCLLQLLFKGLAMFLHQEELFSDLLLPLKIPQNIAFWILQR